MVTMVSENIKRCFVQTKQSFLHFINSQAVVVYQPLHYDQDDIIKIIQTLFYMTENEARDSANECIEQALGKKLLEKVPDVMHSRQ